MDFKLPNLGEGVDSGDVVNVTVKAGDSVEKGASLLEVETNKAVMDVTANFSGKITAVHVKAGDKVKPGQVMVAYEGAAGSTATPAPAAAAASQPAPTSPHPVAQKAPLPSPPRRGEGGTPSRGGELRSEGASHGISPEEAAKLHVVVIGAGPGGYAAAFYASDLGFKVTMVSKEEKLGGVCTLRGCIPSKGLLHIAKLINEAKHAPAWGVEFGAARIDVDKLRAYKDGFVSKLSSGIGQVASARKVAVAIGEAKFKDSSTLLVGKEEIKFDYCVIATGSIPSMPGAFAIGDERVMDSTGALALKDIPKRLLVIGGGYIGLEMGCVYAALGSEVNVVEFLPGLLMAADRDVVRPLQERLKGQFKNIWTNTKVEKLEAVKEGIKVTMSGEGVESPQVFDRVLVSVGRRPMSQGLGLENTKAKADAKGFIEHDAQLRTADPRIFVIGDVAGEPMLAHKAHAEAKVAVEAIAGLKTAYDVQAMPAVVFTDPELAWVGVTEEEAKKAGLNYEAARYPWAANGKALAIDRSEGVSKIIVDKESGRILGAAACGFEAGALISEYALAIEMGASASDISLTVHPHPTLNETLLGAVDIQLGHATDIYRPKKR